MEKESGALTGAISDACDDYQALYGSGPTLTNIDAAVGHLRALARLVDGDEEGDRVAGIYRDLFREAVPVDWVLAVINLGVHDLARSNSYAADALSRAGLGA